MFVLIFFSTDTKISSWGTLIIPWRSSKCSWPRLKKITIPIFQNLSFDTLLEWHNPDIGRLIPVQSSGGHWAVIAQWSSGCCSWVIGGSSGSHTDSHRAVIGQSLGSHWMVIGGWSTSGDWAVIRQHQVVIWQSLVSHGWSSGSHWAFIGLSQSSDRNCAVIRQFSSSHSHKKNNDILLPKLFWPTVRKNCSSDREKLL